MYTEDNHSSSSSAADQAFIGMMMHAVADGVAVGAASLSSNLAIIVAVSLAMVLHKGPMAFGLATYLATAGWSDAKIHKAMFQFALCSPAAAAVMYVLLRQIPHLTTPANIALCMIFSGGTFMYAACVHILPTVVRHGHSQPPGHSSALSSSVALAMIMIGSVAPLLLSALVPHSH